MRARSADKGLIREINETRILDILRVQGEVPRSKIARLTGLSPATVTTIVARLLRAGLVREVSAAPSTGGRPPQLLALDPGGVTVAGAWVGAREMTVVTVNLAGEITASHSVSWSGGPHDAAEMLTTTITALVRSGTSLRGVGVTLSATVDSEAGTVRHSGMLGWQDVPLGPMISDRIGLPVTIDRHVNALAASMLLYGQGHDATDLLVVSVGSSLGLTIVLDGRIHRGAHDAAGRFAHTAVSVASAGGKPCHCGRRGCLETVASESALAAEFERRFGEPVNLADVASRAAGDAGVRAVFTSAGRTLGRAVADVAKIIDPGLTIVAGSGSRLGAPFLDAVQHAFHEACSDAAGHDLAMQIADIDPTTWARGAASLLLAGMFRPSLTEPTEDAAILH